MKGTILVGSLKNENGCFVSQLKSDVTYADEGNRYGLYRVVVTPHHNQIFYEKTLSGKYKVTGDVWIFTGSIHEIYVDVENFIDSRKGKYVELVNVEEAKEYHFSKMDGSVINVVADNIFAALRYARRIGGMGQMNDLEISALDDAFLTGGAVL